MTYNLNNQYNRQTERFAIISEAVETGHYVRGYIYLTLKEIERLANERSDIQTSRK